MYDGRQLNVNPSISKRDIHQQGIQYERNPDAEYGSHIKNTAAICNTSASHTYGNVLAVVEKFLLDAFPPDLFQTVMANTSLASRQVRHVPHQLYKKEVPMMILIPRIVYGQEDNRFLSNTIINSRMTNTQALYGGGSLLELARDKHKHVWVHGHYNRDVMYVDVVLLFNTYSEQVNYMTYIHNMIPVGHNQFIRAPLELYIPETFCQLISNLTKVPVRNEDGSVHDFLTYMNTIWDHPITYKLKGGSNTDEFFMYYITDIDTVIQDPQANPGAKNGQVRSGYEIAFTVRCEFNTIGYFMLNSPELKKQIFVPSEDGNKAIVPLFSDVINLDDFQLPIGWQLMCWPIFKLDYKENSISFDSILNKSLRAVIDYHLKFGIPLERFIKIQFRENGQIIPDELFFIDWARRKIIITNPNYRRTYRLIVSVSPEYVNNMVKEIYNLE